MLRKDQKHPQVGLDTLRKPQRRLRETHKWPEPNMHPTPTKSDEGPRGLAGLDIPGALASQRLQSLPMTGRPDLTALDDICNHKPWGGQTSRVAVFIDLTCLVFNRILRDAQRKREVWL